LRTALAFQLFEFYPLQVSVVLTVEHSHQFALLVHIPDPHASGQAFVGHFRFVAFGYMDSHR